MFRRGKMADFNAMYLKLFNAVTDAINILQTAQVETEEIYMKHESTIALLKPEDDNDDGENDENGENNEE